MLQERVYLLAVNRVGDGGMDPYSSPYIILYPIS